MVADTVPESYGGPKVDADTVTETYTEPPVLVDIEIPCATMMKLVLGGLPRGCDN